MDPMNISKQNTINERGEILEIKILTHNQSKEFESGTSVDSRLKMENLQDCMYGNFLPRVILIIVACRECHTSKRYSSRRLTTNQPTAGIT